MKGFNSLVSTESFVRIISFEWIILISLDFYCREQNSRKALDAKYLKIKFTEFAKEGVSSIVNQQRLQSGKRIGFGQQQQQWWRTDRSFIGRRR